MGRLFFLHRLTGARELPQAGSPLTGGGLSLRFSGELRSAERGRVRRPPRGQKGRDTCGFPSSLNSYLSLAS